MDVEKVRGGGREQEKSKGEREGERGGGRGSVCEREGRVGRSEIEREAGSGSADGEKRKK